VPSTGRIWSEQKWCALKGRVVELRVEEDGDLHIALADASGDKPQNCIWLDGSAISVSRPVR